MKYIIPVLLALSLLLPPQASAEVKDAVPLTDKTLPSTRRLPGVDLAEGVTKLTGVAISPLLGVSAVGAWQYYRAPAGRRPSLPWFCQPYVWGVGFFLLALCFLKDLFGTVAPPLIKKPLDVAELFESKLSGLVACAAFLPFVVSQFTQTPRAQGAYSLQSSQVPLAFISVTLGNVDVRFVTIPLAIIAFLVVWLSGHAINVLIALCPFGFVDALLKTFKAALLSSVVVSSFINPYLGAVVSLAILFVAVLIAPWAFRLTVFGTLFGLDVILPSRGRRLVRPTEPHAFLARKVCGVPVRTYGRLTRDGSGPVMFTYRPWLIRPKRAITIPRGNVAIARGFLFPSLLHSVDEQPRRLILVFFLPRYRANEQAIASHFEIPDIVDSPLIRGFRAVRAWLAQTISMGKAKYADVRATRGD